MKPLIRAFAAVAIVCAIVVMVAFSVGIVRMMAGAGGLEFSKDHVAVLDLEGVIMDSDDLVRDMTKLSENELVKAVVIRINSPGGVVGPSQEYYQAIKKLDEKVPVIISMGAVAASGGYYAALGGRKIYANPGTLTASIGVIMEFVNTQRLYEWAKVKRFTLKSGKLKDAGSPLRPMTEEEKKYLNTLLDNIHTQFRATVKERRKIDGELLRESTDGRIMTGQQALEAKLVDTLGGLNEALAEAKQLAGLPEDAPVRYPAPKKGALEQYLFGNASAWIKRFFETQTDFGLATGWNILLLAPLR